MAVHGLKESLELGASCLLKCLDSAKDFFPFGGYEAAHDSGRWWDAILRVENAIGFVIPDEIESTMLRNLQQLMSNPDGLLINNPSIKWFETGARINPHNFREGLLALSGLIRNRNNAWAREAGHRLLQTLGRLFQPDGRFDYLRLFCWGRISLSEDPCHDQPLEAAWFDATANSGRALEAILVYHQVTGDALAMELAQRIAEFHLKQTINMDGAAKAELFSPTNVGHNHSYLGTLRGLLQFGMLTERQEYVNAVLACYRHSLWGRNISEAGWTPHDLGKLRFPNADGDPVAEAASCGDVAQLALRLALGAGHEELLDDVERLVRSRLLPEQLRSADMSSRFNDIPHFGAQHVGGWGVHGDPFGKGYTIDVFAAVLHTLADIYEHVISSTAEGRVSVNLHFDINTPLIEVRIEHTDKAYLTILPKRVTGLRIRVPGWAPKSSVWLGLAGIPLPHRWEGRYLTIEASSVSPGSAIELRYDLPYRESIETMPVSGQQYRFEWRGDEIISCAPEVWMYPPRTKNTVHAPT